MPTVITHIVNSAGGADSTTIAEAEADTDNDLVSDDEQIDVLVEDAAANYAFFNVAGATVDPDRFRRFTAAPGDHYDPITDTGTAINQTTGEERAARMSESFSSVEYFRLEVEATGNVNIGYSSATDTLFLSCFFFSETVGTSSIAVFIASDGVTMINCITDGAGGTIGTGVRNNNQDSQFYNCIIIDCTSQGFRCSGSGTNVLTNCISIGNGTDFTHGASTTLLTCASEDTSSEGTGSIDSITPADVFEDHPNGDFRMKDGASTEAGTDLSGIFTLDFARATWGTENGFWKMGAYDGIKSVATKPQIMRTNIM